jgi:deoxyribose-phosphate aldolase
VKFEEKIYACIDLTSLNDSDTEDTITALCQKATATIHPVAAVCVYPRFVAEAKKFLLNSSVKIATVANFPEGTDPLEKVVNSIQQSIRNGANEIDVVFPYQDYLKGNYSITKKFVETCKNACGNQVLLKIILETGALKESALIVQASKEALYGGADFIKTSTGKIAVGATLEAAACMLEVLREWGASLDRPVGFKVSGGIRTLEQAAHYVELAETIRGKDWVTPQVFRIGTSQLSVGCGLNKVCPTQ